MKMKYQKKKIINHNEDREGEKDMNRQLTKRYKNCLKICKDVQSHL